MKIYTKVVMDWDGNVLEEESYDYDGPVAHCSKDSVGSQKTTTTVVPWKEVQPNLIEGFESARQNFLTGGIQPYPGQTYVPTDPMQDYAQNLNLAYAQQSMPGQVGQAQNALSQMLTAPDVANNQYIGGVADVIQNRLGRQFQEQLMPRIGSNAVAAGQYGGSRQGVAEGLAARGVFEATGDALAQLYGDAYGQGLTQQARGMGYVPAMAQFGMAPMEIMGNVGAYRQAQAAQALQDDMQRFSAYQEMPFLNTERYLAALQGASPYAATTGTQQQPGASPLAGALGLGQLGLGAYGAGLFGGAGLGALGTAVPAASIFGPLAAGAGAGAGTAASFALPAAASTLAFMSDRRLKKNVKSIGEHNGYKWYEFEYIDPSFGEGKRVGVMADEVERVNPAAVHEAPSGYKFVDYGAL